GHGVGVKPFQSPVFNQNSGDQLQVGDIVTLEPGLYFPKRWGMRIENDFLVAETGAMLLFDYPLELEYFILR
ncbi:MAG: M24 family metallopeptidase, partial [Eubacteriales bacterium]|nr:M24 family metallopeptidase [Eubacteriales bacterium]